MSTFIPFHAYEASAGAGKTFSLVVRYLSLLFMDEDADKILALTFTNKAANEMQERIIETLMHLPNRDERFEVAKVTGIEVESLLEQRQEVLSRFLKSDAKVMTIDKFFAKILRKFSLHAGLMPTFSTFASQHEIKVLARFLTLANMKGKEKELISLSLLASKRLSDIFSLLNELYGKRKEIGEKSFGSGEYIAIENEILNHFGELQKMVFASNMSEGAKKTMVCENVEEIMNKSWIEKETLAYWQYKKGFTPEMDEKLHLIQGLMLPYMKAREAHFFKALFALLDIYEEAKLMVAKEESELSFDDITNLVYALLKERVDSEFLYFRLDARISHILLDEFQDTSVVQFEILKPLIDEMSSGKGVSEHNSLFIVGDVKQSIYRFRGGTKELFYHVAKKYDVTVDNLLTNYRSDANVVNFVNTVFAEKIANYKPQLVRSGAEQGYVEVISNDEVLEGVREQVLALIRKGADADSIAILTQTNGDGSAVESLLRESGIEVVTETTSLLINQKNIRALIEYLKYSYFNEAIYARNFFALLELEPGELRRCDVNAKDLADELLKVIEAYALFDGDLNLLRFLQLLGNYRDIEAFLFEYERLDATAAQADLHGVRVLTVHKSKGLEYENVIVMDRLGRPKADTSTIIYQYEGTVLKQLYLRMKKRAGFDREYAAALADEERLSHEDAMHALYVAFTRAKKRLYIIQKSKDSKFDALGLTQQRWGEEQITQQQGVIQEPPQSLAYEARSYGVQSEIIKEEEVKEEKDQYAIEFGLALHYTLEMMAAFEESAIDEGLSVSMNRYGAYLKQEDFESIKRRIQHLVRDQRFKALSSGSVTKERAISYATELRYIDLLVQQEDRWVVMDYKSAKGHDEAYHKQVGFYKKAVASITDRPVSAYLVYLLDERCEIVEVQG
jgi:exodeoxyribonuclease V beta subunit